MLVLRQLRAGGYDVTAERVDTAEAMHAALVQAPWDLVISDYALLRFSGTEALQVLQASGHDLPFILVSGAMGEETAVNAMKAGAHDYLLKSQLARLATAVQRELASAALRREHRQVEVAAQRSAALLVTAGQVANIGGWSVALAEGKVTWSNEVARIHDEPPGYSPKLAEGINYYAPAWREKITAVFGACARDGTPYDEEMEIITARGRRVWVRTVGNALRDNAGVIRHVHGAFQDISTRKYSEQLDSFLAQAGGSSTSEPFFNALARFLAQQLQMDYICIDRLDGEALNATTVAVWHDGRFEDNLTYALKDTPCGEVVGQKVCCYPAHVCQAFPRDPALQDLRAESYVGVTLFGHSGQPIGLIAVIGRHALANREQAEATLARVAPRAAGEMERLTTEAALARAAGLLEVTGALAKIGGWEVDLATMKLSWTPETFRIAELDPPVEPPLEQGINLFAPAVRPTITAAIQATIATGTPYDLELPIITGKGSHRWVQTQGFAERQNGKTVRLYGTFQDITARRQTAAALADNERKFRQLFEESPIGKSLTQVTGEVMVNRSFCRMLGYTAPELADKKWEDISHPDDVAMTRREIAPLLSGEKSEARFIKRYLHKNGTVVWGEVSTALLRKVDGQPLHFITTVIDITERKQAEQDRNQLLIRAEQSRRTLLSTVEDQKRAEQKMRQSETRFRNFLEQVPLPVCHVTKDGVIDFRNRRFHEILGYTPDVMPTLTEWWLLAYPDPVYRQAVITQWDEAVSQAMASDNDITGHEYRVTCHDGQVRTFYITGIRQGEETLVTFFDLTKRKAAEAELLESEARFRSVIEGAAMPIFVSLEMKFNYLNPAALALLGASNPADLIGQPVLSRIHPDYHASIGRRAVRVFQGERNVAPPQEEIYLRMDGTPVHVEATASPIIYEGQHGAVVFVQDITERIQSSQLLRESETKYRALVDNLTSGVVIHGEDTAILFSNAMAATLLGLTNEQMLGKTAIDPRWHFLTEDGVATPLADYPVNRVFASRAGFQHQILGVSRPDRTQPVWVIWNGYPVMNAEGRIVQAVICFTDITEQKLAQDAMRKLSRIIEQAPLSIIITNLAGSIEYVNPRFCAVTGYTPPEMLGQNPRLLKSEETPPAVYRDMWQLLRSGQVWSGELRNRKKNGELYLESAVIAPVVDPDGRITHYVALKDDITAQRRLIAETTARMEKEHELSEMKTRFISVTSHEFRTPMAAAMGSAEILINHLDHLAPAKRQELLGRITHSMHRMTEMLDEVLLLNRMDADRIEVRLGPVDLRLFLGNIVDEIRLGDQQGHVIDLQAAPDLGRWVTDPNLLHHILTNLLSNAVRYSPPRSVITLRAAQDPAQLEIAIEDQGIGVPAADMARIFEPFERGSNVGTIKGTGLGLSIVKRMAGLLGGTITLTSPVTAAGGSCFTLGLPVQVEPPKQS
jgi:PAS domain S-box-containing protein